MSTEETKYDHQATYSPEDDKIRLYLSYRLSAEDYAPIKAAGYHSAPKQGFVFAVWSPSAEDIALRLCGEIEDEDKSLVDRAEERAERFEEYSDNRKADYEAVHKAVSVIADNIPLGQPILVGHHSEKRARRDARKIENGMRRAVNMWKTSEYWKDRAASALAHAKYKERPDVRARRIKTLESDLRKSIASYTPLVTKDRPNPMYIKQQKWADCYPHGRTITREEREVIPEKLHVWTGPAGRGGTWTAVEDLERIKASSQRYEEHLMHRLEYETAMLGEQIGVDSFSRRFDYAVGGKIRHRELWLTILKLNKKDGETVSVSTNNQRWPRVVSVEDIAEYQPPEEGAAEQIKAALKRPPLCNYPGEGFATCTSEQWKRIPKDYKSQSKVIPATETTGAHCTRYAIGSYLDVQPKDDSYHEKINFRHRYYPVFVTDEKRKDPPALTPEPAPTLPPVEHDHAALLAQAEHSAKYQEERKAEETRTAGVRALEESLKAGVQVVSANQLFPTPHDVAQRMADEAELEPWHVILEPSAGTGAIINGICQSYARLDAIEINATLADRLRETQQADKVSVDCVDFLSLKMEGAPVYDRVLMNPPFENGNDIKHILHALTFLKPGGRLVAICANGPRQQDKLRPIADYWEELPEGTFEGTGVRTAILVINKPAVTTEEQTPEYQEVNR